jgi:hypothetical protein
MMRNALRMPVIRASNPENSRTVHCRDMALPVNYQNLLRCRFREIGDIYCMEFFARRHLSGIEVARINCGGHSFAPHFHDEFVLSIN